MVEFWLIDSQAPKIVSGGQTGADRAALDWALSRGIKCRGWCPKGRKAEDAGDSEQEIVSSAEDLLASLSPTDFLAPFNNAMAYQVRGVAGALALTRKSRSDEMIAGIKARFPSRRGAACETAQAGHDQRQPNCEN